MKREKIVFADPDQEYLNFLEGMIVPELEEESEILMISDFSYFQKYTSVFQKRDLSETREKGVFEKGFDQKIFLFVWKDWGRELWRRCGGKNIVLMGEEEEKEMAPVMARSWEETTLRDSIYMKLERLRQEDVCERQKTKTFLVYSPIGGSGVSSVAREMAQYLTEKGRKVFFIGADTWQDCRGFVDSVLEGEAEEFFVTSQEIPFSSWKRWVWHGRFDVLTPFAASYRCLGLTLEFFRKAESAVKESREYDWIVVETDHTYSEWISGWIADADQVAVVVRAGEKWSKLFFAFHNSVAMIPREKFCILYNFFGAGQTEDKMAKSFGWDGEIFLEEHGRTDREWQQWRDKIGEILCEK
ncbi:MAG: hypothetical protein SO016_11585 [Lachnospiraceae bacterium]|nr:hypothetical protein [Robinsoniella sp.]MDY3767307.1 hypothetical protein [Lachnospiraceae bacterium]